MDRGPCFHPLARPKPHPHQLTGCQPRVPSIWFWVWALSLISTASATVSRCSRLLRALLSPPLPCITTSAVLFPLQTPFRRGGYSTPVSKLGQFLNLQSLTTLSVRLCICSSKHQFCPSNPISNQTRRNNCSPFLTPSTKHHNTSDEPNPLAQSLPQYILCIQSSTSF